MNSLQKLVLLLVFVGSVPASSDVVCSGTSQYLPNPDDCSSFYECSNGQAIPMKCSGGLEFSVTSNSCNYPELAQCGSSNSVVTGPATASNLPSYYCPEVDGPSAYIYPNPLSCSSYYMCAGGYLHPYQCQTGLEYSVEERGCDYPYRAKCDLNNLPTFPSGPTAAVSVGPTPAYYCPEVDGPTAFIYPNPLSCSSYYMCAGGSLHPYQCQTGLEYSVEERGCDYPYRAKCDLNNLPAFPSGPTTPASIGPTPAYYCPEVDGPNAYIYPNPLSCSSFFMCAGGSLQYYKCQTGLEYSVEERGCDYPERAKCDLNNLPSFPTGATEPSAVTSTTASPAGVICPANVETLVRDPTDCGKFYECNYGIAIRESCYPGLYFSEKSQACDYPQNVPECTSA